MAQRRGANWRVGAFGHLRALFKRDRRVVRQKPDELLAIGCQHVGARERSFADEILLRLPDCPIETKIGEKKVGQRIEPIIKRQLRITPRGASMSRDEALRNQMRRAQRPDFLRCRVMVYQDKPGGPLLGQSLDFPSIKTSSEHPDVKHREFEILTTLRKALSEMFFEHRLANTQPQWQKQPAPKSAFSDFIFGLIPELLPYYVREAGMLHPAGPVMAAMTEHLASARASLSRYRSA